MKQRDQLPGEFELIAHLVKGLRMSPRTILGPGDDCAILAPPRRPQVFTIDSMVEGVHFRLEWGPPEKLGAKALAVNLSDIAAMGATPAAFVINLGVREGLGMRFFDRLYTGLKQTAAEHHADLVGGNITRAERLSITVALLGESSKRILLRSAAKAGYEAFVTGTLGDSAAGLRILTGSLNAQGAARRFLLERHLNPTPRIKAGLALARMNPAPAAIDISDGLLQDLGHILERSGVGAEIEASAIPLSAAYRKVLGGDLSFALSGGEDYELLFCIPAGHSESRLSRALGLPVRRIGRIIKGRTAAVLGNGSVRMPQIAGWIS